MVTASTTVTVVTYTCEMCDRVVVPAATVFDADKPEGFHVNVRQVTGAGNHYRSDGLYLCSKTCLTDFTRYGLSAALKPTTPIGPKTHR